MTQRMLIFLLFAGTLLLGGWLVAPAIYAAGTIVTVNRTGDISDMNPGDGICDASVNLGSQCNLRAAIEELNALGPDSTPHRIEFDIAGTGPFTFTPGSPLPDIVVPVEIVGTTQSGASCPTSNSPANLLIVLDGINAGTNEDGLVLDTGSDGSSVRGLVIGNFDDDGIRINSNGNNVRCNHIGLDATGNSPMGNGTGIFVAGMDNDIGGAIAHAARNVISANDGYAIQLYGSANRIENNFIGPTAVGLNDLGNGSGILISFDDNTIGSSRPFGRNLISGNDGNGIYISQSDNNHLLGNYIGVARDGVTPLANNSNGVVVFGNALGNVIGGVGNGEGNIIAHNEGNGVQVQNNGSLNPVQNEIRGNTIFDNLDLGIDLGGDGVDVNDPDDADSGENERQNYPVVTDANTLIELTLDSAADTLFIVDVYRNDSCDSSGFGEGQEHLDWSEIITDGQGHSSFSFSSASLGVTTGDGLTATATDPDGNTSEFSACVLVEPSNWLYLPLILK